MLTTPSSVSMFSEPLKVQRVYQKLVVKERERERKRKKPCGSFNKIDESIHFKNKIRERNEDGFDSMACHNDSTTNASIHTPNTNMVIVDG